MIFDYHYILCAIALIYFHWFLHRNRLQIQAMIKGGNGILQTPEALVAGGLYFFFLYSLIVITLQLNPDYALLGIFVSVAGGGSMVSVYDKTKNPRKQEPKKDDLP